MGTKEHKFSRHIGDSIIMDLREKLRPFSNRMMTVGSLGREEMEIGDVDYLIQPKDLKFIPHIEKILRSMGEWNKGGNRMMSVKNVYGVGIQLDLFLQHHPAQWGLIVAYRLNPIPFVKWLKSELEFRGYRREKGTLMTAQGKVIPLNEEKDVFELLGLTFYPAHRRWEMVTDLELNNG